MKDLGYLKYFLGIKVAQTNKGMYLCQRKYVLDIPFDTKLLGAKPTDFPIEENHQLENAKGDYLTSPDSYQRTCGIIDLSYHHSV